ncbi:MAG: adenine deaminase, partial [Pseudomonadota bacterium]
RATVRYEIGGLMTARPAGALDSEWRTFLGIAEGFDWHFEPSSSPRWGPGFPERLQFATLTCAPWRWVLVAPNPAAPTGLVNVATGESHPVVW